MHTKMCTKIGTTIETDKSTAVFRTNTKLVVQSNIKVNEDNT